jgi:GMP synthase PP-ATPase subunit
MVSHGPIINSIFGHAVVIFCVARCQLLFRGHDQLRQLGRLVGLEVNLVWDPPAIGHGLGTGVVGLVKTS